MFELVFQPLIDGRELEQIRHEYPTVQACEAAKFSVTMAVLLSGATVGEEHGPKNWTYWSTLSGGVGVRCEVNEEPKDTSREQE